MAKKAGPLCLNTETRTLQLDPRADSFYRNPYAAYAEIHVRAPVLYWKDYGMWCFFSHADVNRLLRDRRFGREILHVASREELGLPALCVHTRDFDAVDEHSMLEREPPVHTRLRSLVNRAFVTRRIETFRSVIAAIANELIDAFPAGRPFDLLEAFATPIPVRIIARMLGVPEAMAPQLLNWSNRMVKMYAFGRDRIVETEANAAAAAFSAFIRQTVSARRRAPGDDVLSVLVAAEEQGDRLTADELVSTAILLLNAGHEATVHALGNAVVAILRHVKEPSGIFSDPATAANTVEETLRFAPPLHLFTRYVLQNTEECGISLRKGEKIGLVLGATGYDPAANPSPQIFDPVRSEPAHTAFGAGIHYCLGAPLARLELSVALTILFERCPALRLIQQPVVRDNYHFHGYERLMVCL
jgi:cytochrome P450